MCRNLPCVAYAASRVLHREQSASQCSAIWQYKREWMKEERFCATVGTYLFSPYKPICQANIQIQWSSVWRKLLSLQGHGSGRQSGCCALPSSSASLSLITERVISSVVSSLLKKTQSFGYAWGNGFEIAFQIAFFIILITATTVTWLWSYHPCHQTLWESHQNMKKNHLTGILFPLPSFLRACATSLVRQ